MRKHSKRLSGRFALLLLLNCVFLRSFAQLNATDVAVIEKYIVNYNDVTRMKFINDSVLYREGWHTLAQPKFWQQVMVLSPDSAIINVASTRQVLSRISLKEWNKWSEFRHAIYKDSIRRHYALSDSENILVTTGKKDFYEFKKSTSDHQPFH